MDLFRQFVAKCRRNRVQLVLIMLVVGVNRLATVFESLRGTGVSPVDDVFAGVSFGTHSPGDPGGIAPESRGLAISVIDAVGVPAVTRIDEGVTFNNSSCLQ